MIHERTERGQALILIALAVVGLFAFAALTIDGTRVYSNKRHAQNAADTSALAGALASIRCTTGSPAVPCTTDLQKFQAAKAAAIARATSNGFKTNVSMNGQTPKVVVALCSDAGNVDPDTGLTMPPCVGIESGHASEYIRVWIVSTLPTTFGRVIGRQTMTTGVEAIARVQGDSGNASGGGNVGAAMVATREGNQPDCLKLNGGADIYTHNSGVYINCSNVNTIFMNSNIKFDMDARGQVVGCYKDQTNTKPGDTPPYDPIDCGINGGKSIPEATYIAQYAKVPTMPDPPTSSCGGKGTATGGSPAPEWSGNSLTLKGGTVTITGGSYGSITINSGNLIMSPGLYCFSGDFNVNASSATITGNGKVQMIMGNASFNPGNGQTFTFNDLELWTTNGGIDLKGVLNADRFRFYSSGNGVFKINAGATATSKDAYIYLANGYPNWNGQSNVVMTAPKTADSWGDVSGMVLHMPWSNTNPVDLNGGATTNVHGTFMMPHSYVTFNGGTDFKLYSQIIAYYFTVNGGGTVDIWYNASENYNPPKVKKPTIQLTK